MARAACRAIADTNMKRPTGPLFVFLLVIVGSIVAGMFVPPYRGPIRGGIPPEIRKQIQEETIKKIQDCIDHWRDECAQLDFRPLNGIKKQDLIQNLPAGASMAASASIAPVCEEDATGRLCTRVHWRECPGGMPHYGGPPCTLPKDWAAEHAR